MTTYRRATPYVCARCASKHLNRPFSTAQRSHTPAPSPPPPSGAAKLTNRRLVSLHGQDAPKFLQGIITNNINTTNKAGFYAAFLTAQGKVLHDVFVYPSLGSKWHEDQGIGNSAEEAGYLVEVDADQTDVLLKHLKRHKLRSKFNLRLVEDGELEVWSTWKEGDRWTAHGQSQASRADEGTISLTDCRAPGMGQRVLLAPTSVGAALEGLEEVPLSAYTVRRYLKGVAEGQKEMPRDDCLPMNCNIDIMGGIDFKKGCYVGQELTIRTHHTGVVRRRLLPIMIYDENASPPDMLEYDASFNAELAESSDMDIRRDDQRQRKTGRVIASIGNVGLGMCRLEQMSNLVISGEGSSYSGDDRFILLSSENRRCGVKAFVPDWIRGNIREPKLQKRVQ